MLLNYILDETIYPLVVVNILLHFTIQSFVHVNFPSLPYVTSFWQIISRRSDTYNANSDNRPVQDSRTATTLKTPLITIFPNGCILYDILRLQEWKIYSAKYLYPIEVQFWTVNTSLEFLAHSTSKLDCVWFCQWQSQSAILPASQKWKTVKATTLIDSIPDLVLTSSWSGLHWSFQQRARLRWGDSLT